MFWFLLVSFSLLFALLLSFQLHILNLLWRKGEQQIQMVASNLCNLKSLLQKKNKSKDELGLSIFQADSDSKWFWFCIRMWMQMWRRLWEERGTACAVAYLVTQLLLSLPLPPSLSLSLHWRRIDACFLLEMEDRQLLQLRPGLALPCLGLAWLERKWSHRKLQITQSHDINFRYALV